MVNNVNYYNRHIGDYAKQTAHLTFAEDGAYNRMLDYYYSSEHPLPLDREILYRKVRARNKSERLLIDQILTEFFHESADGWHKNRCDQEIIAAREAGEENAAKKENEKERQRRHRLRRKELYEQLRGHGIVPKWDVTIDQLEALLSQALERDCNAPVTRTATAVPIANSQVPITSTKSKPLSDKSDESPEFLKFWKSYPRKEAKQSALKAWSKLRLANGDFEHIMQALESFKLCEQWTKDDGKFIPHPATWINKKRWEDEQPTQESLGYDPAVLKALRAEYGESVRHAGKGFFYDPSRQVRFFPNGEMQVTA